MSEHLTDQQLDAMVAKLKTSSEEAAEYDPIIRNFLQQLKEGKEADVRAAITQLDRKMYSIGIRVSETKRSYEVSRIGVGILATLAMVYDKEAGKEAMKNNNNDYRVAVQLEQMFFDEYAQQEKVRDARRNATQAQ